MDDSGYSIPIAAPLYGPLPYLYRGCPQLLVPFRVAPGVVRRLVPEPLEPNADDMMFLMIGQMNSDEFGTNREAFLAIPSRLGALSGNFAVALYLDNDAAIASGREVWGWPKKAADFAIADTGATVTATATRHATEIIRARLDVEGPAEPDDLRLDPTWFNAKLIPSIVAGAPPEVMQITSTTLENVRVTDARRGRASLEFGSTVTDPLAELIEVAEVLAGVHFHFDCDLTLGEVVHDYLAEGAQGAEAALSGSTGSGRSA
jgi:acetoacetate decarboxylase